MASITLEVKMKNKKKGSSADGFGFDSSSSSSDLLIGSLLLDSLLIDSLKKDKKKNKNKKKEEEKEAYKASEEDIHGDKQQHQHRAARADLFGLSVMSEEEHEKMKNNTSSCRGRGVGVSVKEDNEGMRVKVEMPGLEKENVKVSVVNNTLLIEGDEKETDVDDENEIGKNGKKKKKNNSSWGIYLPDHVYKSEEMKAVMKSGVLTVVVPKLKEEDRKDVIHVLVEESD